MPKPDLKKDIQKFWGALSQSLYQDVDPSLTKETLTEALEQLEDMFKYRRHMAVTEMPLADLAGKKILEIGSGGGGHSALFAKHGADITSLDITYKRAQSTAYKLQILASSKTAGPAVQADAENLPFPDGYFDIVYSNGVLHHSPDTQSAIDEVWRTLKPGGEAIILLYCKSSWHYWFNMFFCVGLLQGKAFTKSNWLGPATEWGGRDAQTVVNPVTRCYGRSALSLMFGNFNSLNLRKGEFYFYLIPKLGRLYRRYQIKTYGTHPGGFLVYGEPWPIQSRLELWLGKFIGWSWFISATK